MTLPSISEIGDQGTGSSILDGITGRLLSWGWTALTAAATLFFVLVGGVFLALKPSVYRRGLVSLIPNRYRQEADKTFGDSGRALRLWLTGQLISMAIVAVLVGVGAWLIGLPAPLALGLLAGLAEFIPMLGPILGAIPALLLALTVGPTTVLWTLLLFMAVQQLESNIIMPQVQREMVHIPPALYLFSVFAFGILFGVLGVLLAGPLTVATFIMIKHLVKESGSS